jgi:hypothetical protein
MLSVSHAFWSERKLWFAAPGFRYSSGTRRATFALGRPSRSPGWLDQGESRHRLYERSCRCARRSARGENADDASLVIRGREVAGSTRARPVLITRLITRPSEHQPQTRKRRG